MDLVDGNMVFVKSPVSGRTWGWRHKTGDLLCLGSFRGTGSLARRRLRMVPWFVQQHHAWVTIWPHESEDYLGHSLNIFVNSYDLEECNE